jgi:hypothetical protein
MHSVQTQHLAIPDPVVVVQAKALGVIVPRKIVFEG